MLWDDMTAVRTLYGEIRGGDSMAQRAVAHVIFNRLASKRWGTNLAQVCLAKAQFSCWLQSDPNWKLLTSISDFDPKMIELAGALSAARHEDDFTKGATHYHSASMAKAPIWTLGATLTGEWGNHKFYRGVE